MKPRSVLVCFFFLIGSISCVAGQTAQRPSYVLGGFPSVMPFASIDGKGPYVKLKNGIIKDLADEISKRTGWDFVYYFPPRKRMEGEMAAGRIDFIPMAHPLWLKSPSDYTWSEPWISNSSIFISLKSAKKSIRTLSDIKGMRLGLVTGYVYPELPEASGFIRDNAALEARNIRRLEAELIDVVYGSRLELLYYIKGRKIPFDIHPLQLGSQDLSWACRKDSGAPIDRLNAVLKAMLADGSVNAILSAYR